MSLLSPNSGAVLLGGSREEKLISLGLDPDGKQIWARLVVVAALSDQAALQVAQVCSQATTALMLSELERRGILPKEIPAEIPPEPVAAETPPAEVNAEQADETTFIPVQTPAEEPVETPAA